MPVREWLPESLPVWRGRFMESRVAPVSTEPVTDIIYSGAEENAMQKLAYSVDEACEMVGPNTC